MKRKTLGTIALVWGFVMVAVLSSTLTLLLSGRAGQTKGTASRWVTQEEYDSLQRYRRLDEVRTTLMADYYRDVSEEDLVLGAIRGMTGSLEDPYTFYYTPEELKRANENNSGNYRGIGILLQNTAQGTLEVIQVYAGSPAEAAGLMAGDRITAVDGTPVNGLDGRSYNEAESMIRGGEGTSVILTVLRGGEALEIPVKRGDVSISYARWQTIEKDIGYIGISQFTGDASQVFRQALEAFRGASIAGLVVDLRNNPGGFLDQVVDMADQLLPEGIVVYVEERDGARQDYYSDAAYYDVPLAVLVNENSASASEILASSVQAFGRGTVVGTNTYGKGVVQSLRTFDEDGAGIQLTTSSYYDALGRCPQGVGVQPDLVVEFPSESIPLDPDPQGDEQLSAAIARLRQGTAQPAEG
ncbi:MAG: S41 family peptidase [Clostridia bacterium]|nr:S41 family peptidase [Clostridia bacterium]